MPPFSQQVKTELCAAKFGCRDCEEALLYGMLLFTRGIAPDAILFNTENRAAAHLFTRACVDLFQAIVTVTEPDFRQRTSRPIYSVSVADPDAAAGIVRHFFPDGDPAAERGIDTELFQSECCLLSFLRGAYLACGTMISPEKEYHLEFSVFDANLCEELSHLLEECELHFRQTTRSKNSSGRTHVLYVKESEQIEDTLARLGAVRASMELMNLKIEKELRNQANRVTNCETANIGKTVNAAMGQIRKIERVRSEIGFDQLPTALRETAELRLSHPELSLRELCELSDPPLSRSGLNHRLQRLCEMADQLDQQQ